MIWKRIVSVFKTGGAAAVLEAVGRRIRTPRARIFPRVRSAVAGAVGIEVGGPSAIFAPFGMLPVYPLAARIDNCNFAASTIWERCNLEGESFRFDPGKSPGRQIIAEGVDLHVVAGETYDFVLSSHMLEHTANPLRALAEWRRILKPSGALLLVVPHRDGTFDRRRPVTALLHLIDDFERRTGEGDPTHLDEVAALQDRADASAGGEASRRDQAERNLERRSLHHHVFDTRLAVSVVSHAGFLVEAVEPLEPCHIVVLARNATAGDTLPGLPEESLQAVLRRSPFPSDRAGAQR